MCCYLGMGDEMRTVEWNVVPEHEIFKGITCGQKVHHDQHGNGIVVGFSNISGEPFVFFYAVQRWYGYCVICLGSDSLKSGWVGE